MKPLSRAENLALKLEYISGKGSVRELAGKYGANPKSVERRCQNEGWVQLRKDHENGQIAALVPSVQVIPAKIESPAIDLQNPQIRYYQTVECLQQDVARLNQRLKESKITAQETLDFTKARDLNLERIRIILGIPDPGRLRPTQPRIPEERPAVEIERY